MIDCAFLVLLYGKEIRDSSTVNSLNDLSVHLYDSKVVIWNNGPKSLYGTELINLEFQFDFIETINNKSLSEIYNEFISGIDAKKYIILDDDSEISLAYIQRVLALRDNEVGMPIITCNSDVIYPIINGVPVDKKTSKLVLSDEYILTIGSGLVVGSKVGEKIKNKFDNIFDENFYFYGVDFTFCYRLNLLKLNSKVKVIAGFNHKLSKLEKESDVKKHFRKLERSYDFGLQLRYYNTKSIALLKLTKFTIRHMSNYLINKKNGLYLSIIFKAFLTGRHYKNKI
ncbi:hypothetical protein [Pseudoalteromonas sp. Z9A4]|uniref:hypothetical protein n=1 Tax=Pseudoalteromonas sp. Z9A4 TaxID=2686353 RepID=UPI001407CA39|nr:hypothetical protein [Pseudoalteromonas sp. Z9A4]